MKRIVAIFAVAILIGVGATDLQAQKKVKLKTQMDSMSYALGMDVGTNLAQSFDRMEIEYSLKALLKGIQVSMDSTAKRALTDEEQKAMMKIFQKQQEKRQQEEQAKMQLEQEAKAKGEITKGIAFLEANKKKEGVKVTASGLQYKVVKAGDGKSYPSASSKVQVFYTGKLLDGSVFDSSDKSEKPVEFGLNQVISGWTEGLQLMSIGAKYIFYIPSELAYGSRGAGKIVPPGATLIFEVELLDILVD